MNAVAPGSSFAVRGTVIALAIIVAGAGVSVAAVSGELFRPASLVGRPCMMKRQARLLWVRGE